MVYSAPTVIRRSPVPVARYCTIQGFQVVDKLPDGTTVPWQQVASAEFKVGLRGVSSAVRRLQTNGTVVHGPKFAFVGKRYVEIGELPRGLDLTMLYKRRSPFRTQVRVFQRPSSMDVDRSPRARATLADIRSEIQS